ncbi:MAG: cysteine synthase A [Ruminococcaceae bacterium]|nr:cysteine synthase A [Oscillospiraceae bacterium]
MIYTSIEQLIGGTPLLQLKNIEKQEGLCARLLAKLEGMNPAGSAKDRVALSMLNAAEAEGKLTPDAVVIEPTSGNTGIGLAAVAAARGLRAIIVMPDSMSVERQRLMTAYGAELVLTDGARGMAGAIEKAEELAAAIPHAFVAGQFQNPANPAAHHASTGPEIWDDTAGAVDIFVAGVGTGGTVTGVGEFLKSQNPSVQVVGVEPASSAVLSGKAAGAHGLQGIGAGFVPAVLNTTVLDEVLTVTEEEAYVVGRMLGRCEGVLAGISAGAALSAAITVAKRPENTGKTVVVLLPDTGERYLSTPLFSKEG